MFEDRLKASRENDPVDVAPTITTTRDRTGRQRRARTRPDLRRDGSRAVRDRRERVLGRYRRLGARATAVLSREAGTTSDHRHRRDGRRVRSDGRHELRQGAPYEEILDYVDEQDIDLVAMGTHGRAGVGPDLGSTTLRVVRNADVPVLTVRSRSTIL
ncbi:universal stress protein [Halovenus amylolytica]|uniref:universal stress protein n=1 Tax=Halovenus amylolytica TaxID=2500550 RepID=UPI003D6BB298